MKRKIVGLFTVLLLVVCSVIGVSTAFADNDYSAMSSWTKVGASSLTVANTTDGTISLKEDATGGWDANVYSAVTYNYPLDVNNVIDVNVKVANGNVFLTLANNGWYHNYNTNSTGTNSSYSVGAILAKYNENTVTIQNPADWGTSYKNISSDFNKLSFKVTDGGTEVYFNDELLYTVAGANTASFMAERYHACNAPEVGTALLTLSRFSADNALDAEIYNIPVNDNVEVKYNLTKKDNISLQYKGLNPTKITAVKVLQESDLLKTLSLSDFVAQNEKITLKYDAIKDTINAVGNYTAIIESSVGNLSYKIVSDNVYDATYLWESNESTTGVLTGNNDGSVRYVTSGSSDNSIFYAYGYKNVISVDEIINIAFNRKSGVIYFRLTDGKGGSAVTQIGIGVDNDSSKFTYNINNGNSWPIASLSESGYTTLSFEVLGDRTNLYCNGTLLTSFDDTKALYETNEIGVEIGYFNVSWAKDIDFSFRVGSAEATTNNVRFIKTTSVDVEFTFNAYFAEVSGLYYNNNVIDSAKYTLVNSGVNEGRITFTNSQVNELFADAGEHTITIKTAMGDVDFKLNVISADAPFEIINSSLTFDKYANQDVLVPLYINLDAITDVKKDGNSLNSNDFVYDMESKTLTIKASYLSSLSLGNNTLTIVSEKNTQGSDVIINVEDHTPPIAVTSSYEFDKNTLNALDVVLNVNLHNNQLVGVSGNEITASDYLVSDNNLFS